MPRPVCVICSREMRNAGPVVVQFSARSVGGAYEQWHGDKFRCDNCDAEVVTAYGEQPSWRHHDGAASAEEPHVIVAER